MKSRFDGQSALFLAVVVIAVLFGTAHDSLGTALPCPVVTETTLAQKAAEWVTAFQKPYCDYLGDYSISIVNQKSDPGILHQASGTFQIFQKSSVIGEPEGSAAISRLFSRIRLMNPTVSEMASVKLRVLRSGTAITAYAAGRKAFMMARDVDSTLSGFAPTAFDFASKHQTQKDITKLAHLRGLVQSQELRLASFIKMLDALDDGR